MTDDPRIVDEVRISDAPRMQIGAELEELLKRLRQHEAELSTRMMPTGAFDHAAPSAATARFVAYRT